MKHSESNKAKLFTRVLPELAAAAPYFSIAAVKRRLAELQLRVTAGSLRQYLSEAMEKGLIHDAGRGWYSRLAARCELDSKPVAKIIRQLEKEFPLLDFTCWSTQQVNPWMHHILSKFLVFVNVDRDGLVAVAEFLRAEGYEVHANPTGKQASDVRANGKAVVVRPLNAHAPRDNHYALPEAVLVDLFVESKALGIMGRSDSQAMLHAMASSARLAWGTLLHYAEKRELKAAEWAAQNDSLTAELYIFRQ